MEDRCHQLLHGCLETLVLAGLAEQPMHGYGLRQLLARKSRCQCQPAFGRLYPLLARLQRQRLVTSRIEAAGRVRTRKLYALTTRGRARLAFLLCQWKGFHAAINRMLGSI